MDYLKMIALSAVLAGTFCLGPVFGADTAAANGKSDLKDDFPKQHLGAGGEIIVAEPTGIAAADTANIQGALDAARDHGGGLVQLSGGAYLVNRALTITSNIRFQGQGMDVTTIRLAANSDCDLLQTYQFNLLTGKNSSQGVNGTLLRDMTLDQNGPKQSSGWNRPNWSTASTRPINR